MGRDTLFLLSESQILTNSDQARRLFGMIALTSRHSHGTSIPTALKKWCILT